MNDEEESEVEVLVLQDENGVDTKFALLTMVELDGVTYAVLAPLEQLESEEPDLDFYGFVYNEDENGDVELDAVEDEELLDRIFAIAEDELFGEEDFEDDDDADDDDDDGGTEDA